MALSGSSSGLLVALVAVLLLPAQYYVPELYSGSSKPIPDSPPPAPDVWLDLAAANLSPLDLIFTVSLIVVAFLTYICEWIQRKLMERRLIKLNQFLSASLERLRGWDVQQERLEATLRTVRSAAGEYELLLWLLLRAGKPPPDRDSLRTGPDRDPYRTGPDRDPYRTGPLDVRPKQQCQF